MSDNENPLLNRASLGSVPILDEAATARILDALAVPLVPDFPKEEFARFLNDAAQFALEASFSTRPTPREIDKYKATVGRLIELTQDFHRRGISAPMPPEQWRDQAGHFGESWTKPERSRQGYALNDPQFSGALLGLFHAATGLEPTETTSENNAGGAGPFACFVMATLQELRLFCEHSGVDDLSVNTDRLRRLIALPESGALRKQIIKARAETNWKVRAKTFRTWAGSTEKF